MFCFNIFSFLSFLSADEFIAEGKVNIVAVLVSFVEDFNYLYSLEEAL